MKQLLILCLLALSYRAAGQVSPLPIDSTTGKVTYQGVVQVPGTTADAIFARAKAYAVSSVVPPLIDENTKTVSGIWETQVAGGRMLRYEGAVFVKDGRYRYELSDFENKTAPVQHVAGSVTATAPGGTAPLERVLANPDGYRKGKPTAALLAYRAAVDASAKKAVADLQQKMKVSGKAAW